MQSVLTESAAMQRRRSWSWSWVIPLLAVMFPLLRLWPLDGHFTNDWFNHKWLVGYTGEYLRQHHSLPAVLNTTGRSGMPYPVFYGALFYPILAPLTRWIGAGVVLRLAMVVVTWLEYWMVARALVRFDVPRWIARAVACLVIWAIYPLTNLYNRSALTEYFATALLVSTLATWFMLLRERDPVDRVRLGLGSGLLFVLTAGSHPITALYSLPVMILLLAAGYAEHGRDWAFWRSLIRVLVLPGALVVTVLAPWLYALARYQEHLQVFEQGARVWFYDRIDWWTTRFSPVPYDPRTNTVAPREMSAPYLDAQVNMALLALLIGWLAVLYRRNRAVARSGVRTIAICLVAFAFFTWISLCPWAYDLLPAFFGKIQIAYRAITYQNISLLLAVFMLAGVVRRRAEPALFAPTPPVTGLLVGCLTLSATGVITKWIHPTSLLTRTGSNGILITKSERRDDGVLHPDFYGRDTYATAQLYTPLGPAERPHLRDEQLPIGTAHNFGVPQPLRLSLDAPVWLGTTVQAFPWNHIAVDGVTVPDREVRVDDNRLVVPVPAGDHTVTMQTSPDAAWLALRALSLWVLALWCVSYAGLAIMSRRRRLSRAVHDGAPGG